MYFNILNDKSNRCVRVTMIYIQLCRDNDDGVHNHIYSIMLYTHMYYVYNMYCTNNMLLL